MKELQNWQLEILEKTKNEPIANIFMKPLKPHWKLEILEKNKKIFLKL